MIRMILTDLDHTLLREDGTVSGRTLRAIRECRAKGILFAIATARYWAGARRYIELLEPDYEITTDGTLVHSRGRSVFSRAFSVSETNGLIGSIARSFPGAEITAAVGKTVYRNVPDGGESERLRTAVYREFPPRFDACANKIAAVLPQESAARRIAREAGCALRSFRGEDLYAFLPPGAGKTEAILAVTQESGIRPEDIVSFGDDRGDIDMLKLCGTGIAVANALPEVLKAADGTAPSNGEDGVAAWLEEHCLRDG